MSNSIKVGSLIKSYDFNSSKTCFVISEVTEITKEYYVCEVKRVVFDGVDKEIKTSIVRVSKQGLVFGDREDNPRIEFLL